MLGIGDQALQELLSLEDAEELCRRLLARPWGWGSSTRHQEAVGLLASVSGTSELEPAFVALMVCTCQRWDRVTGPLIAALEHSGLLGDGDLDELAETLLSHEHVIVYPLTWVSPDWVEIDLDDGRVYTVSEDAVGHHHPIVEPPLRRWAARRRLADHPAELGELFDNAAKHVESRHRDAVIHGLLDAADAVDERGQRTLVGRGLACGQARVRLAALNVLCGLDGPEAAQRRAQADPNATVREWMAPTEPAQPSLL